MTFVEPHPEVRSADVHASSRDLNKIDNSKASPKKVVIVSDVPEGIVVGSNKYGRCLLASKAFSKGEVVYKGSCQILNEDSYTLVIGKDTFEIDSVHTVKSPDGQGRQVYGFDGFMNHSCDPNCYCPGTGTSDDGRLLYDCIAMKDIQPGDELTADYALFDYECDGHGIEKCLCESSNCRGHMLGFKALTLQQKIDVLPYADPDIVTRFLEDNPKIELIEPENTLPNGVCIDRLEHMDADRKQYSFALRCDKFFPKDSLVFRNRVRRIYDPEISFLMKVGSVYTMCTQKEHTVSRGNYCEFLGFDTFMNHSCEPSCYQFYATDDEYEVHAARDLAPGTELTCDYHKLENQATGDTSLVTIDFVCQCGAPTCRGRILA